MDWFLYDNGLSEKVTMPDSSVILLEYQSNVWGSVNS